MTRRQILKKRLRRGSVYIAVTGTAILISLIGLTSLHLARLELRTTTTQSDSSNARQLAQSGIELAMAAIDLDSNWRNNYAHGVENVRSPSVIGENITFRFVDNADNDLANDATQPVEIQGIGRCGDSTFIYSVTYAASVTPADQVGPLVIQSYDSGTVTQVDVSASTYTGQYFVPTFPAGTASWKVTRVDVYLMGHGTTNGILNVKLYTPDAGGNPDTLIENVSFVETLLPAGSYDWHQVNYSSVTGLAPGDGLCLALEGTGSGNAATVPYNTGVTQTNSHRLNGGNGNWYSPGTSHSIQYRVYGTYLTSSGSGPFTITTGSWQSVAAP